MESIGCSQECGFFYQKKKKKAVNLCASAQQPCWNASNSQISDDYPKAVHWFMQLQSPWDCNSFLVTQPTPIYPI